MRVHLRNGDILTLPDGSTNQQIAAAVKAKYPTYQSQGVSDTRPANWNTPTLSDLQQQGTMGTNKIYPFLKQAGSATLGAADSALSGIAQGTQNLFSPVYGLATMPTPNLTSGVPDPKLAAISSVAPYLLAGASGVGSAADLASIIPGVSRTVGQALLPDLSSGILANAARVGANQGITGAAIGAALNSNPYNPGGSHPLRGALYGGAVGAPLGAAVEGASGVYGLPKTLAAQDAARIIQNPLNSSQLGAQAAAQRAAAAQAAGINPSIAHIFETPASKFNQFISSAVPRAASDATNALNIVEQNGRNLISRLSGGIPENEIPQAATAAVKAVAKANQAKSNAMFEQIAPQADKIGINTASRPALEQTAQSLYDDTLAHLPESNELKQAVSRFLPSQSSSAMTTDAAGAPIAGPTKSFNDLWKARQSLDRLYRSSLAGDNGDAKYVYGQLASAARNDIQNSLAGTELEAPYAAANQYYMQNVAPLHDIQKLGDGDYKGLINIVRRSENQDIPSAIQSAGGVPDSTAPNLLQALLLKKGATEGITNSGTAGIVNNYENVAGQASHLITPTVKTNVPLFTPETNAEVGGLKGQQEVANQMAKGYSVDPNVNAAAQGAQYLASYANPLSWTNKIAQILSSPVKSTTAKILADPGLVTAYNSGGLDGVKAAIQNSPGLLSNVAGAGLVGTGLQSTLKSAAIPAAASEE